MIRNPNYAEDNFLVPTFEVSWPFYTVESDYLSAWACLIFAIVLAVLAYQKIKLSSVYQKSILGLCAIGSVLVYTNFLTFHGPISKEEDRLIQSWDMFHYVIGARYQPELGYDHFYDACLLALREIESDKTESEFWQPLKYRDMRNYEILPGAAALMQTEEIKAPFTEERWQQFIEDIEYFYRDLTPDYFYNVLGDHGYNPPPTYTLVARLLLGKGDITQTKLLLLASIDWLLLIAIFGLISWGFGLNSALITTLLFGIAYMSNFSWVGNAFLRFGWLAGIVAGIVFQKKGFSVFAGLALGFAAGLRVFPGFVLFALAFPFIWSWLRELKQSKLKGSESSWVESLLIWRQSKRCVQLMKIVTAAALFLVVWGLFAELTSQRSGIWIEWKETISLHEGRLSANHVGIRSGVTIHPEYTSGKILSEDPIGYWNEMKAETLQKRSWIYLPIILIYLGLLLACARKTSPHIYMLISLTILFFFLDLSGYYYSFLALFPLLFSEKSIKGISIQYASASLLSVVILGQYLTQQKYLHLDWVYAVSSLVLIFIFLAIPVTHLFIERKEQTASTQ